jgi:hypothetical protein
MCVKEPLSDRNHSRDALIVIGAFALGQAIHVNNGVIHPGAIAWLMLALLSFITAFMPAVLAKFEILSKTPPILVLSVCAGIQLIELMWDNLGSMESKAIMTSLGLSAAGVLLAMYRPARLWQGVAIMVLGHFFAGAITIQNFPRPGIDVWNFQDDSTAALLHGQDPYAVRFRDIYGPQLGFYSPGMAVDGWLIYSFPYPPLMLILTAPGRFFGGDVRWAHLVALELSALLLVAAARRTDAILAAALLLFTPRSLFVIKVGWTEPTVLLTFCFCIYCAAQKRQWLWIAVGLLLAIKQYTFVTMPLLLILAPRREAWRILVKGAILAACITLPFFLWNPISFFRSVVLWQMRQPFRRDALSIPALIDHLTNVRLGMWFCAAATCGAIALACRRVPKDAFGFSLAICFVLLCFFAANKQAFCNYYFMVIGVGAAAAAIGQPWQARAIVVMPPKVEMPWRMAA